MTGLCCNSLRFAQQDALGAKVSTDSLRHKAKPDSLGAGAGNKPKKDKKQKKDKKDRKEKVQVRVHAGHWTCSMLRHCSSGVFTALLHTDCSQTSCKHDEL